MVPAKEDFIRGKSIESILDWFDDRKESYYTLGWVYLREQSRMEELFYRTIRQVHRELPRYKRNESFEMWVTSIFLGHCRELARERENEATSDVFGALDLLKDDQSDVLDALDQLKDEEMDAVLLVYVRGFSQEEAAHILRVSVEKLKLLLFSEVQSARNQLYGSSYHGCGEYHKNYLDYLERSMARPEKIEFEKHIYHCPDCQGDLATFQDTTITIMDQAKLKSDLCEEPDFMEKVKKRLNEQDNHKQRNNKRRIRLALVVASLFAFLIGIGFFTGAFTYAYYGWTEENEQLRAFLQQDLGQRVKLEAKSNGVKIKITGVVADDVQTLVFYKIEDTEKDHQYVMSYHDGVTVENESEILNPEKFPRFQLPDLKAEMNKEEKNVFYGNVALPPLLKEEETISLRITNLAELSQDPSAPIGMGFRSGGVKRGDWQFDVPVSKQPSKEIALDEKTEIEGIPVRFKKLTLSPTATVLEYDIKIGEPGKRIDYVQFGDLEVNNKKVKADPYGNGFTYSDQDDNWSSFQTLFDSLYGKKPKELTVQFLSAYFTIEDEKSVALDVNQGYPQTFDYAGSTISIDKVEVGNPTTVVISDREIENREYESMHFTIVGENENEPMSMEMNSEGIIVDRNGKQYDPLKDPIDFEKLEQPRHFATMQTFKLDGDNVIPKRIDIFGYNTTKYLDERVKINLK